ncbi:hypothetical protein [Streptomyces sp. KLOTTS4A1]|uniref:hypothetical protein n=1 Tax=Streptomyces sp. KLOTTS4A1 TaxID=3390996 RepID=UPI0039F5C063
MTYGPEQWMPPSRPGVGWAAPHPLLTAPPLGTALTQGGEDEVPVTLRSLVLSREHDASGARRAEALGEGLMGLLADFTGSAPERLERVDDSCGACGRVHNCTARGPDGTRTHFSVAAHGRHVVYAVSRHPVGLAVALPGGAGPEELARARKRARLAAHAQAVERGRCTGPRDGLVEYLVRYVETPPGMPGVVSVVCQLPLPRQ